MSRAHQTAEANRGPRLQSRRRPIPLYSAAGMPHAGCVFCDRLLGGDLVAESPLAAAFPDAFPLSPGHALIVPRRHEPDFWALRETEKAALWEPCHEDTVVPVTGQIRFRSS